MGRWGRQSGAGWSSLAARRAHNPKVEGSNPSPATKRRRGEYGSCGRVGWGEAGLVREQSFAGRSGVGIAVEMISLGGCGELIAAVL
jgi:hypothetical protein